MRSPTREPRGQRPGLSHIAPHPSAYRPTNATTHGDKPTERVGKTTTTGCDMARARKACPTPGCPNPTTGGRCHTCTAQADRARRPDGNPYNTRGHRNFRDAVLSRDPICTLCQLAPSTIADHHPTERRDLITQGRDPNDPQHGRGLCKACHDHKTATTTPGGWNATQTRRAAT